MEQKLNYDYYVTPVFPAFIGKTDEPVVTYMSLDGAVLDHECIQVQGKTVVVTQSGESFEVQVHSQEAYGLKYPDGPKPTPEVMVKFFKWHCIHKMKQTVQQERNKLEAEYLAMKASVNQRYDVMIANIDAMHADGQAELQMKLDDAIKWVNEEAERCGVVD